MMHWNHYTCMNRINPKFSLKEWVNQKKKYLPFPYTFITSKLTCAFGPLFEEFYVLNIGTN